MRAMCLRCRVECTSELFCPRCGTGHGPFYNEDDQTETIVEGPMHWLIRFVIAFGILICIAMVLAGLNNAYGADREDEALVASSVVLLAADWMQTRTIAKNPSRWSETNPILGEHPSVGKVNAYFAAAIVGTIGLAIALPKPERRMFLGLLTVTEAYVIFRNNNVGIGLTF